MSSSTPTIEELDVHDGVAQERSPDLSAAPDETPEQASPEITPFEWLRLRLSRYEVVIGTVAVIVLLTRVSGGAFTVDRLGPAADASGVTPFTSVPAATDEVVAPSSPEAALPASPTVTSFPPSQSNLPAPRPAAGPAPSAPPPAPGPQGAFAPVPAPGAPTPIAVAADGGVWVGTDNGPGRGGEGPPKLFRYAPEGNLVAQYTPARLHGGITALVPAPDGGVHLLSRGPAGVFVFDPASGATRPYAAIPDVTPCLPPIIADDCDGSVIDQLPAPTAMAFDAAGNLFVADAGQGAIWRIPAGGGEAEQWLVQRTWTNPARPAGPTGLAFDGAGNLVVVVQGTLTEDVGIVYLVNVGDDGRAHEAVELARTEGGARPSGVALGTSGRMYIPLSTLGLVLVLGADGEENDRLPSEADLDTPAGVAFHGTDLLVTVQAPTDPTQGRVVRVPVGEAGGTVHAAGSTP